MPGVAGLCLLGLYLVFVAFTLAPAEARLERLRQNDILQQQKQRHSEHLVRVGRDTPVEQLAVFYSYFSEAKSAPDWLDLIYQAAREHNLKLEQGEYRVARERAGQLTRYQITLPVKGSYLQIRGFLARALSDVPIASLDSIKFERQKVGDGTIEAKVKMTMYLGSNE